MRPKMARTFKEMNIQHANTEPFVRLHRFHENLNEVLKIVSSGLEVLRSRVEGGEKIDAALDYNSGAAVGKRIRVTKPALALSRMTIANLAIAHVYSAFDDFCVQMVAEVDRVRAAYGLPQLKGTLRTEDGDISLSQLYTRCGFGTDDFVEHLVAFIYFQMARNIIVHRGSQASAAFARLSEEAKTSGLAVPTVQTNRELPMQPIHAIIASDNCHKIAQCVNNKFLNVFGLKGS